MTPTSARRPSIMIVDDMVHNLQLLRRLLEQEGYEARPVPGGELALRVMENSAPDLVLLDINMPEMDGYEVCRRLKADLRFADIPVIFVSALDEALDKVKAFEVGGVDYVTKPFQLEEVLARVRTHLELSRTRRDLESSVEKLRELERLRDSLVHMVVHDMRSPLSAIHSMAEFLRRDLSGKVGDVTLGDVDDILDASLRLVRMSNDLLDVRRMEASQMPLERAEFDLVEVVQEAVAALGRPEGGREVTLLPGEATPITADAQIVRRVVENLVGNGLKHTPNSARVEVSIEAHDGEARVSVRDEGQGIPEAYRESIFQKFETLRARTDRQYHSTGLGLAFCKLAVEAHGGRIGVDSELGEGSTFWFTLPFSGRGERLGEDR